jgi:hypothetical protein
LYLNPQISLNYNKMSNDDEITPAPPAHAYVNIPQDEHDVNETASNLSPPVTNPAPVTDPDSRFARIFWYCLFALAIVAVIVAVIILSLLFTNHDQLLYK